MSHTFKDRSNIKHHGWRDRLHYKRERINKYQLLNDHHYFK